jgi:hypothetical protein
MNEIKQKMIEKARNRHTMIYPCSSVHRLEDSFTVEGKRVIFWYNTEDHSTHLIIETLA